MARLKVRQGSHRAVLVSFRQESRVRLGAKSNLSEATIRDFEIGRRIPHPGTLTRIRQALEGAGVVFTSGGPSLTNLPEGELGGISVRARNLKMRDGRRGIESKLGADMAGKL